MKKYSLLFIVVALMSIVCSVFADIDNSDTSWTGDGRDDAAAEDFIREWDLNTYIYGESDLPLSLFGMDDTNTEEDGKVRQLIEIHALEDVSETDFEGTWIPFVQYLRFFKDVIALDDTYAKDYILINNKHIYITIVGNTFTDLPYKFDDNAVLTAINGGTKNEILVTLRLLGEDYMLYSLFFDGKTQGELLCYRLESFRQ